MKSFALNFHGIGEPGDHVPSDELPYWIGKETFEEIVAEIPKWSSRYEIAVTFDDGNKSDLEIAAPILAERGIKARFFVLTGRLGLPSYLTASDVRELREMGFIVGLHGFGHVDWKIQSDSALQVELGDACETLEDVLGGKIDEVGIPFGSYNRRVLKEIRERGFKTAWTSDGGPFAANSFLKPRTSITSSMTAGSVEKDVLRRRGLISSGRRLLSMSLKKAL